MQRMLLFALIPVILTACAGFQGGGEELVTPTPSRSALSLYAQARIALNEGNNERALALVREAVIPHDGGPAEVGRISFLDNAVNPATGTIRLKGLLDRKSVV